MKTKWNNVRSQLRTSIGIDGGEVYSVDWDNVKIPQAVKDYIPANAGWIHLVIDWKSSGYNDPGCWNLPNGDPGYPPEGDDERTMEAVRLEWKVDGEPITAAEERSGKLGKIALPAAIAQECFDALFDKIEAEDLVLPERGEY